MKGKEERKKGRVNQESKGKQEKKSLDMLLIIVPLMIVAVLCALFMCYPALSTKVVNHVRGFLANRFGWFYMLLGAGVFGGTLYIAFSKYGRIRLGNQEKPQYTGFQWGAMIFTSTMAADILYYSCIEWALYGQEPYIKELGGVQKWASTYPLFHWGPIPWGFYIILAVAFGFMLHVRGRKKQKFSEALRPLLGGRVDGMAGRIVDLFAIFALLAGTATTFSLATPLLSEGLCDVFHLTSANFLTVIVLALIAAICIAAVLTGFKGIVFVAKACVFMFLGLVGWVLLLGGQGIYILETGITAVGNMMQNFVSLATNLDPLRTTGDGVNGFVQNWTVFYWAYWLVWCVATPFFIAVISRGRTIKNVILGGYGAGIGGTYISFIVFGNYGLAQQMKGHVDSLGALAGGASPSKVILQIFHTLPGSKGAILLLAAVMIAFYATTFDTLTMVISIYSYRRLEAGRVPDKRVRAFWAILFIVLPVGLLSARESIHSLQSVSIIAALPIGVLVILIVAGFLKDASYFLKEGGKGS